ncbi:AI-2E family transporter [Ottowia sp.]|uniref:AI-2E family transporter n=1 Tax=Ottowia sp. TaxID=1898956 RepID=UPI002C54B164|nr:AI-2E family transporter [Ottowia sp.]HOB66947.1 AI-2E family transporter [Ottowia sp.]HPZ55971.1 AI-2E family transporter [Ottowia sp.]HQD47923.1 AI-2E family transporter [Ottowia sp.]
MPARPDTPPPADPASASERDLPPPDDTMAQAARQPLAYGLVSAAVIVAALYFGRDVLMPLALAVLVGFVLDPMVSWLKRRGVPRLAAVIVVVLSTLALLAATGFFIFTQLRQISNDLPVYETNITRKLRSFGQQLRQPGLLDQYSRVVNQVEREIEETQRKAEPPKAKSEQPMRVEVVGQTVKPWQRLLAWAETFTTPLAMAGIVFLFVVLILLDKGELRDKVLRLLGGGNLHRSTDALGDAAQRVSKYLTMQLVVNATYGIPMALGLLFIGVPGALVWGLLAAVLRFVPYLGPVIGAVFPLTLAFAVDPGWDMVLWTVALIVTLELISNNLVEPWLYGTSTGMSTLSLILAAMFWTALWGPIGLVLATPITVVLLALGHHLPQLRILEVLLGSAGALDESTRLHQRLLAGDVEEAAELAARHADEESPQVFYDGIAMGALRLASSAYGTVATAEQRHRVVSGMERVIEELREQHPPPADLPVRVACIGGRWAVDSLAADMAAHVLALEGIGARVVQSGLPSADYFARLDLKGIEMLCLCYFSPEPTTQAKYFVRRLKRHWPQVQVLLAAWNFQLGPAGANTAQAIGVDALVTSLGELVAQAQARLVHADGTPFQPAPMPENERQRLVALHGSGVLDAELRGRFDAIAKRAADAFDTPVALVSLIGDEWQITHGDASAAGRPEVGEPERGAPRPLSLCGHVVAGESTLVVPDVLRDARFAANPVLKERGIRFYAGAPLKDADGLVLGTLCLLDTAPRTLTPRDVLLLENMAAEVMSAVEKRVARQGDDKAPAGTAALPAGA